VAGEVTNFNEERVLSVHHWNDALMSFTTTRNSAFRFQNGQFVMMGLTLDGRPLLRAYSVVSANYDEHLEFYSIKIPGGALTSRLATLERGHSVLVTRKPTGTLLLENLLPAKRLYLLATGTGLAPFMSIIRDPRTYERFERIVLAHGVRRVSDLGYRGYIEDELFGHDLVGDQAKEQLLYYPTVTREPFHNQQRLTHLIDTGKLFDDLALPPLDRDHDRVMLCGSPAMLRDLVDRLDVRGFQSGTGGEPGQYVIERAFAER
jgi:ferredoxin--NADP+ reductase